MINSVAIQRLLEAAVMLKLERGTRVTGRPPPNAQSSQQATTAQQPIHVSTGNQNQRSSLNRIWNNPPILPPDSASNGALAIAATVLPRDWSGAARVPRSDCRSGGTGTACRTACRNRTTDTSTNSVRERRNRARSFGEDFAANVWMERNNACSGRRQRLASGF